MHLFKHNESKEVVLTEPSPFVGEGQVFTVEWAVTRDSKMRYHLNRHYHFTPQPFGTSHMRVTWDTTGVTVWLPEGWESRRTKYPDDSHWADFPVTARYERDYQPPQITDGWC